MAVSRLTLLPAADKGALIQADQSGCRKGTGAASGPTHTLHVNRHQAEGRSALGADHLAVIPGPHSTAYPVFDTTHRMRCRLQSDAAARCSGCCKGRP